MQEPTTAQYTLLLQHPNPRIAMRACERVLGETMKDEPPEIWDMSAEDLAAQIKKLEKSAASALARPDPRPAPDPVALEEAESALLASEGPAFAYRALKLYPQTNAAKIKALVDQVLKRDGVFMFDTLMPSHQGDLR